MQLSAGTRLGPYEILGALGAGGMGEVYKARDTRLDRIVAVKILSPAIASSPEARQRFEREARTISQLSHPHICALFDVGEFSSPESPAPSPYLVMELLEGETLASRLAGGALPLESTIRYGVQIADALDKAHRAGIVHRDLKPANIMITKAGVKLLDFGLAKTIAPLSPATLNAETMAASPITARGMIAGTVQYMAPEQLEGHPADARSDIYAFGAVLYEMASGGQAFRTALKPIAPASLDRIVRACIAADPDSRWQSAHDVAMQLAALSHAPESTGSVASVPRVSRWVPWMVAAAAIVSTLWLGARAGRVAPAAARYTQFAIQPPDSGTFVSHVETLSLALSPDGSQLAFAAITPNGGTRIWLRRMASIEAVPLAGTEGNLYLSMFWSPDGRSLAFFADGKLKRLDLQTGGIVTVCRVPSGVGLFGTWGRDGRMLYASVEGQAIFQVSAAGGTPTELLRPDREAGAARAIWPSFLPDGERFLFTTRKNDGTGRVMLAEPGKGPRELFSATSNAQYVEPGYLVYGNDGTLVARRFDAATGHLDGEPFVIAPRVRYFYSTSTTVFSAALNGDIVYQAHTDSGKLAWFDRAGAEVGTIGAPTMLQGMRVSPDGRSVVFDRADNSSYDLWRADLARGVDTRLTTDAGSEFSGVWHPDGRTMFFAADRKGPPHLFRRDLTTGTDTELLPPGRFQEPMDVTPDGRTLVFVQRGVGGTANLWTMPLDGSAPPVALFEAPFIQTGARFSPDGRFLAFASTESGALEIYVSPFPATGTKIRVTSGGGIHPRWNRDGRELFYLADRGHRIVAVPIDLKRAAEPGKPATVFSLTDTSIRDFDVSADGRRFLAHLALSDGDAQPLTAVVAWPSGANPDRRP
jgi:serine/threonine protein kinase/Tol biopolymer transport system component